MGMHRYEEDYLYKHPILSLPPLIKYFTVDCLNKKKGWTGGREKFTKATVWVLSVRSVLLWKHHNTFFKSKELVEGVFLWVYFKKALNMHSKWMTQMRRLFFFVFLIRYGRWWRKRICMASSFMLLLLLFFCCWCATYNNNLPSLHFVPLRLRIKEQSIIKMEMKVSSLWQYFEMLTRTIGEENDEHQRHWCSSEQNSPTDKP